MNGMMDVKGCNNENDYNIDVPDDEEIAEE